MSTHSKGLPAKTDRDHEGAADRVEAIVARLSAELEQAAEAVGAILHGSHAQGNPRQDSDVDLICVTRGDWFSKEIRVISGYEVEIQNIPERQIRFDMEKMNKPFTIRAFANCRVLFDRDGVVATLCRRAREKWENGAPHPSQAETCLGKSYLRHHLEELRRLAREPEENRAAIEGVLAETFLAAVRAHCRARRRWPAKVSALLGEIRRTDPGFYTLASRYGQAKEVAERISILQQMVDHALEPVGSLVVEYKTPRIPAQVFMLRGESGAD